MAEYNPQAIHRMAGLLGAAATAVMVVFGLSGLATGLVFYDLVKATSGEPVASALVAIVYAALVIGVGYVIALILRVVAQLMLAVVRIELNTGAALDADAAESVTHAGQHMTAATSGDGEMVCPRCGSEYVAGIEMCRDCDVQLVPSGAR